VNPVNWILSRARRRLSRLVREDVEVALETALPQWVAYYTSAPEDRQTFYDHTQDPHLHRDYYAALGDRLRTSGVPVEDFEIDVEAFRTWLDDYSSLSAHYREAGDQFIEKCLEHYLVHHLLEITTDDRYLDVGADRSPWAAALRQHGTTGYRLDRSYPRGMNGFDIGADAGATTLPDGFATVASVHSAYQLFAGDADREFVQEASRILDDRGRYGIVPLLIDDCYYVAISPHFDQEPVIVDPGARKVWRDDGLKVPFSRHYSPESFHQRIFLAIPGDMRGKVLSCRNLPDIMRAYPGQRIYCYFTFVCEKRSRLERRAVR